MTSEDLGRALLRDEETKHERIKRWNPQTGADKLKALAIEAVEVDYKPEVSTWRVRVYAGALGFRSFSYSSIYVGSDVMAARRWRNWAIKFICDFFATRSKTQLAPLGRAQFEKMMQEAIQ